MPVSAVWTVAIMVVLIPAHTAAQQVGADPSTPLLQIRIAHEEAVAGTQRMELAGDVLFVADEVVVQDADIEVLRALRPAANELGLAIQFTEEGASRLQEVSGRQIGNRLGIFVGSRLVSAPRVLSQLSLPNRRGSLRLPIAEDEAESVAEALNARFGGSAAIVAQLPPRPPPPPPIAPPAGTQIDPADRAGVLIAAAAYLRARRADGDSIVLNPGYHDNAGTEFHLRDPNHSHVAIPAEELELLQRELQARPGTRESVLTNCRPLVGCEMTAPHFVILGRPVLRTDGTVTIAVEHTWRTSSTRQPTATSGFELVLTRTGSSWTVTAAHGRLIT